MSCTVECEPACEVYWDKDGKSLADSELYMMKTGVQPKNEDMNFFRTVVTTLYWNLTAWPEGVLDESMIDMSNYSCVSTSNAVGPGVSSTAMFRVECKSIFPDSKPYHTVLKPSALKPEKSVPNFIFCQTAYSTLVPKFSTPECPGRTLSIPCLPDVYIAEWPGHCDSTYLSTFGLFDLVTHPKLRGSEHLATLYRVTRFQFLF